MFMKDNEIDQKNSTLIGKLVECFEKVIEMS